MQKNRLQVLVLFGIAVALLAFIGCAQTPPPEPPVAKIEAKIDTMFGEERVDDYFWMRDRDNEEVLAYLEAENAYTDTVMKHTDTQVEEMFQEIKGRIKETDLSVPVKDGDYYYYDREEEGKQYKIYCRKKGSFEAEEEILLDVNELAEGKEFIAIDPFEVSPDHQVLLYGTDEKGNERYTLHVKDLNTGELHLEVIETTSGNATWANDNKTFFYTIVDDTWRPYQLYRHTLRSDPKDDKLVYQEDDEKFWMGVGRTKNDQYLYIGIGSKTTDEYRYLDANNPTGEFRLVQPREQGVEYSVSNHGDKLYIVTNADGAYNFKVATSPVNKPGRENWKDLIPHSEDVKIDGIELFKNYMVLYGRENGVKIIRVTDMTTDETHKVEFPEPVYSYRGGANPDFRGEIIRFTYMSLTTPQSVYDYNMGTRERELMKKREVLGGYNQEEYQSERVFATADDGTQIPISMVYKKGMVKDGNNPLYLYGYGSYGHSMDPTFSSSRFSLLDRGFVYALAHIRGGGEMGRKWYENGKMLNKKNTFTDFIDCAEYLCEEKYTNQDKIAIVGGSAGGLLVGAVVNMQPDLFEVAVGAVPFVDVMNTMLDETIPLTVIEYEEWGNPNIEEYYHYMNSYSPYDNIKAQAYPHLLIESSLNDTRVQYWEGSKWAAKLRVLNTGDKRLLLKTNMGAGHGGSSGRYDYLREIAFEYVFILDCLNMI